MIGESIVGKTKEIAFKTQPDPTEQVETVQQCPGSPRPDPTEQVETVQVVQQRPGSPRPDPTEQVETVQQRPGSPRPDPTEQVIVTYWHTFTDIPGKSIIST